MQTYAARHPDEVAGVSCIGAQLLCLSHHLPYRRLSRLLLKDLS